MILVRKIHKSFGPVHAVRGVSLSVEPGEVVGLLGPNGAGKSTSMRMLTGFLRPDRGTVEIDGLDSEADSIETRRRIGYLPESAPLYPEMSVRGYLDYRARLFGLDRASRRKAIGHAMERCYLAEVASRRVGQLSKGFKQRVGLAAAILHSPPVLILDEPSNGLDPSQIRETRSLVRELAEDRTMVVSSHILPEVERLATRLVLIASGRVLADGPIGSILNAHGTRQVVAEVKPADQGAGERAQKTLAGLAGVESIDEEDRSDGWTTLTLTLAKDDSDPRPEVAARLARAGFALRELHEARPSLERVFVSIIENADRLEDGA